MSKKPTKTTNPRAKAFHQGDVLIIPADPSLLESSTPVGPEGDRLVLAHGEVTGHAHAFYDLKQAALFAQTDVTTGQKREFLQVREPATLKHEEHRALVILPGAYEIKKPKEYVPNELPRAVAD